MKLIGELKEKVEMADTKEEAKKVIKEAGMELTDEEMNSVAGGLIYDKMKKEGKLFM
ncbi:MAG: hypothetical protein II800_10400 [Lachnospiraceae bacterium]|nr:hypothetical protein [Lachnospiraceae bacterium]